MFVETDYSVTKPFPISSFLVYSPTFQLLIIACTLVLISVLISMLAEKLNMTPEEAERWIVNLIRNARLDAKIDSKLVRRF